MNTYALIDASGLIVNRAVVNDINAWSVPDGFTAVEDQGYDIGGSLVGGVYTPPPQAPVVPIAPPTFIVVSQRQARLALLNAGLLDKVNAAVAASDAATQIMWDYSSEIRSDNPLIAALGAQLGLTPTQIAQLFIQAQSIP
jgi:hypothetical protein